MYSVLAASYVLSCVHKHPSAALLRNRRGNLLCKIPHGVATFLSHVGSLMFSRHSQNCLIHVNKKARHLACRYTRNVYACCMTADRVEDGGIRNAAFHPTGAKNYTTVNHARAEGVQIWRAYVREGGGLEMISQPRCTLLIMISQI